MKTYTTDSLQQTHNRALLSDSIYMKSEIVSSVPPLQLDIEAMPDLSPEDVTLFEALQIDAARIAISAVASLSKLNEVDHMGGGLDMIPPLLLTLSLVDRAKRDFTIENAHTSIGYYSALAALGFLDRERVIDTFRRGLDIPGHVSWVPGGTQLNGGRLGVMIPAAVGQALGKAAAYGPDAWLLCHCGDAGWIAGHALNGFHAAALHHAPITFIMHRNGIQLSGTTEQMTATDPRPILSSLGIQVLEPRTIYDVASLWQALREARSLARNGTPAAIIPSGHSDITLADVGDKFGIASQLEAFAEKNNVPLSTPVWLPGCLMSYRDLPSMLECLFFVNGLPGGKAHHDGHMKGRNLDEVLANPMLQLSDAQSDALARWRALPPVAITTTARPAVGTENLVVPADIATAAAASLPMPGAKWTSPRAGVAKGYEAVAKAYPESFFILDCDLAPSTKVDAAQKLLPSSNKIQLSIEEQLATMMANGLACSTPDPKLVVVATFAAFFEGIAREGFEMWRYQRNLTGANEGLNVTFHLSHVGSCTGRDHFSGWALDWINLAIGYLPYLDRFYAPADARAAFAAILDLASRYGAHIIGIPRDNLPILAGPDRSTPAFDPAAPLPAVTLLRKNPGARKAILGFGASAFVAADAADESTQAGLPVDAYSINALPLPADFLPSIFADYPDGVVTIEDGLIGTPETCLRGFAGLVRSAAYDAPVQPPLGHLGITDPRIAPSDGHLPLWQYFSIDVPSALYALRSL